MAGQAIHGHHPYPAIHIIHRSAALAVAEIFPQPADFAQGRRVIEHQQPFRHACALRHIDCFEPSSNGVERGWREAWRDEHRAQRIDVTADGRPIEERCLQHGRSAAHERVVHHVTGRRQPIDEETGKLWLEAGAIGDFVETASRALLTGPELVGQRLDVKTTVAGFDRRASDNGTAAIPAKASQQGEPFSIRSLPICRADGSRPLYRPDTCEHYNACCCTRCHSPSGRPRRS